MYSLLNVSTWIFCAKWQKMKTEDSISFEPTIKSESFKVHVSEESFRRGGLVDGSTFNNSSLVRTEAWDVDSTSSSVGFFLFCFLASKQCVVGEPAMTRQLLVDDLQANNKIEVLPPMLSLTPCHKKKDCCRTARSQTHSCPHGNMSSGDTWSVISSHWALKKDHVSVI